MSNHPFQFEKTSAVILGKPGPNRQMIQSILKKNGFQTTICMSQVTELRTLSREKATIWALAMEDQVSSSIKFTKEFRQRNNKNLSQIYLSIFYGDSSKEQLFKAFQDGLLSFIRSPYNQQTLDAEIKGLLARLAAFESDFTRTSASYILDSLREPSELAMKHSFLGELLALYPGNPDYIAQLIRVLIAQKDNAKAAALYAQYEEVLKELADDLEPLLKKAQTKPSLEVKGGTGFQKLVKRCLIVDPDSAERKQAVKSLSLLGLPSIIEFENGLDAWAWCEKNKPDLILQEWKLPKLSGPALIQRVRNRWPACNIVVTSSLLQKEDQPLLSEMGVLTTIYKPTIQIRFVGELLSSLSKQADQPEESLTRSIRKDLQQGNLKQAEERRKTIEKNALLSKSRLQTLDAEFEYARGNYEKTITILRENPNNQYDQLITLDLLGKSLLKLGFLKEALLCFDKARDQSPKNLTRLCLISEVEHSLGLDDKMRSTLHQAEQIDALEPMTIETKAKIAMTKGDVQKAVALVYDLPIFEKLLPSLNNYAVALAKNDKLEQSFELYQEAINALRHNQIDEEAIVRYNFALAYARSDKLEQAALQLTTAITLGQTKVHTKCRSLLSKISHAQKTGTSLRLNETQTLPDPSKRDPEKPTAESFLSKQDLNLALMRPGDYCCYKIFFYVEPLE